MPVKVKAQVTWPPLPPHEERSTVELLEKPASIAVVPSLDRNVRVPPAIVSVPGGFATLLPPDNEPPELVKPPWSAYANANGMKTAQQARAKVFFIGHLIYTSLRGSRRSGRDRCSGATGSACSLRSGMAPARRSTEAAERQ